MTRVAAGRGSRGSPDGSVRDVAAQIPVARITFQNGWAIDGIGLSAAIPNPTETTQIVTAAARMAAPNVRGTPVSRPRSRSSRRARRKPPAPRARQDR